MILSEFAVRHRCHSLQSHSFWTKKGDLVLGPVKKSMTSTWFSSIITERDPLALFKGIFVLFSTEGLASSCQCSRTRLNFQLYQKNGYRFGKLRLIWFKKKMHTDILWRVKTHCFSRLDITGTIEMRKTVIIFVLKWTCHASFKQSHI